MMFTMFMIVLVAIINQEIMLLNGVCITVPVNNQISTKTNSVGSSTFVPDYNLLDGIKNSTYILKIIYNLNINASCKVTLYCSCKRVHCSWSRFERERFLGANSFDLW
jgi:hypothetical protein